MMKNNYTNIDITPQEIVLRDVLGVSLEKAELAENFEKTVNKLLSDNSFKENAQSLRNSYFYNLGTGGQVGAKYIVERLIKNKKEKK